MCVHVNMIWDFLVTYKNASVLCQLECACQHQTVNIVQVVFLTKIMKIPTQKGEHSCKCTELFHIVHVSLKCNYKACTNQYYNVLYSIPNTVHLDITDMRYWYIHIVITV